jgi:hypothetical protein
MADTAAQLVDRVLPEVPVRQWVLSLPWQLRYRLAYDAPLVQDVPGIFVRAVFASLRERAQRIAKDLVHQPPVARTPKRHGISTCSGVREGGTNS